MYCSLNKFYKQTLAALNFFKYISENKSTPKNKRISLFSPVFQAQIMENSEVERQKLVCDEDDCELTLTATSQQTKTPISELQNVNVFYL